MSLLRKKIKDGKTGVDSILRGASDTDHRGSREKKVKQTENARPRRLCGSKSKSFKSVNIKASKVKSMHLRIGVEDRETRVERAHRHGGRRGHLAEVQRRDLPPTLHPARVAPWKWRLELSERRLVRFVHHVVSRSRVEPTT